MSGNLVKLSYEVYNKQRLAVRGDRDKYQEIIKAIGGRWNPRMRGGEGWLVPISQQEKLEKIIRDLTGVQSTQTHQQTTQTTPQVLSDENGVTVSDVKSGSIKSSKSSESNESNSSQVKSDSSDSDSATIPEVKSRKQQKKYHREQSEDTEKSQNDQVNESHESDNSSGDSSDSSEIDPKIKALLNTVDENSGKTRDKKNQRHAKVTERTKHTNEDKKDKKDKKEKRAEKTRHTKHTDKLEDDIISYYKSLKKKPSDFQKLHQTTSNSRTYSSTKSESYESSSDDFPSPSSPSSPSNQVLLKNSKNEKVLKRKIKELQRLVYETEMKNKKLKAKYKRNIYRK